MTLLYTDPLFLRHRTRAHPERPERLEAVTAALERAGLVARCRRGAFAPLTAEDATQVHAPLVVARAKEVAEAGGGNLDLDTQVGPDSYAVALAAAGAAAAAVDAVLAGEDRTALALVRPPGHHATPTRSMGFCLFNSVALAARRALDRGLSRVLVIDWDVHHGNGTQDIFYEDGRVTFFSIHRYGFGFYPGTGAVTETGSGPGLGHTINAPLRYGVPPEDYHAAYRHALERAAELSRPELVLVSAGFDAHGRDPIGSLGLETEDYVPLTELAVAVARTHAGGRLVSCLEGGYDLEALGQSVAAHLEALLEG